MVKIAFVVAAVALTTAPARHSGQGPGRQDGPSRYADRAAYRRPRPF
jgi:hypothetical protein